MIDFAKARKDAFHALQAVENVSVIDERTRINLNFPNGDEVWEVKTEIYGQNKIGQDITLLVNIKNDFPLSLPKIYLSDADYSKIKYIPHVDLQKFICTYDIDTTRPNPDMPGEVVLESLRRAKKIISDGILGLNQGDFEEEFLAYWNDKSFENREDFLQVLSLVDSTSSVDYDSIRILSLKPSYRKYLFAIVDNEEASENFRKYLRSIGTQLTEHHIFFVENINLPKRPPHDHNNKTVIDIITNMNLLVKFKSYISKTNGPIFVLSTKEINKKKTFIGWFHRGIQMSRNGFRQGSFTSYQALSTFQSGDKIIRVTPEVYTLNRLQRRTEGHETTIRKKFLIAGVGSIGSNLVHFLNSLNQPEFRIIDNDFLKVENIGRHLLGLNFVNQYKSVALKDYLVSMNPARTIRTKEKSVIEVILDDPKFVNDVDYIFSATGKTNIDQWLSNAQQNETITKPLFILWIEPHLSGGHCLYLHPDSLNYNDFHKNDLYKYNIIHQDYYASPANQLSLKEAGCQSSYIPYSSSNVIGFLSALFPHITDIIEKGQTKSISITFIGNLQHISNLGIPLSDFAKNKASGTIIKQYL